MGVTRKRTQCVTATASRVIRYSATSARFATLTALTIYKVRLRSPARSLWMNVPLGACRTVSEVANIRRESSTGRPDRQVKREAFVISGKSSVRV